MRYVAALIALLLIAAAAAPAAAGPRGRPHPQGYGAPYSHVRGPGAHERREPHARQPEYRGHRDGGARGMGPRSRIRVKPLDSILGGLRRQHPGRHLFVRGVYGPNGEPYLRVKWLTPDGRVLWFFVDARTGQVVNDGGGPQPQPSPDGS